ncbi:S-layer glycoprotein N-glycosyltransferase AglJ [Halarchaeum sp. CBA1220]|uniref:S-layer glycoprotein N-glycosyltransferase AglJ n=1 Tax=Halarchaeum sp. CBA1220 TaxID=1853682 RepID=UPI000F3A9C14|nr:S-layer glycoprotein N-glycosyltransferase AglJ [Halarchaeum sp. CBA1220]QLC34397.1 S-layer glycoprotein N-glycosyltransferase AglJ [Halarchaeum sp. CBA1220]
MPDHSDVCVLIPTLDEAETIGEVIEAFRDRGFDEVLVVDGHSTDGTRDIAREHGARVVEQSGAGKGQAVREGVERVERPYVLMLDGDGTYRAEDADAMLEPIFEGRAEHVIGDRFAEMEAGAMSTLNGVGNSIINRSFSFIHGHDFRDILSGYRAFTVESFERMHLTADGFAIETEMAVECAKHDIQTRVVDITYLERPDESDTNLRPFRDGARIIFALYKLAKTNNPLFYFGSVGAGSTLVGFVTALYVAVEWVTVGVSHNIMALFAAFTVLLGIQLLMFGVLSDLLVTLHREQLRRLENRD